MEAMRIRPNGFIDNIKHTLQHLAHEWHHGLDIDDFHDNWCEFTSYFSRYFSTQGRNIKHLHERWQTFPFDPSTDDIEEYIRDVREAAKQLGHGDNAVLNLLKATMPTELYGTLYSHDNLYVVMTILKDIYAKKPQNTVAVATRVAQEPPLPSSTSALPPEVLLRLNQMHLWRTEYCSSQRPCIALTWMENLPENHSNLS